MYNIQADRERGLEEGREIFHSTTGKERWGLEQEEQYVIQHQAGETRPWGRMRSFTEHQIGRGRDFERKGNLLVDNRQGEVEILGGWAIFYWTTDRERWSLGGEGQSFTGQETERCGDLGRKYDLSLDNKQGEVGTWGERAFFYWTTVRERRGLGEKGHLLLDKRTTIIHEILVLSWCQQNWRLNRVGGRQCFARVEYLIGTLECVLCYYYFAYNIRTSVRHFVNKLYV